MQKKMLNVYRVWFNFSKMIHEFFKETNPSWPTKKNFHSRSPKITFNCISFTFLSYWKPPDLHLILLKKRILWKRVFIKKNWKSSVKKDHTCRKGSSLFFLKTVQIKLLTLSAAKYFSLRSISTSIAPKRKIFNAIKFLYCCQTISWQWMQWQNHSKLE